MKTPCLAQWIWVAACLVATAAVAEEDPVVERGRHLVALMLCNDCHTPKIMGPHGIALDESRLLSGHPGGADEVKDVVTGMAAELLQTGTWTIGNAHFTAWSGPWGTSFSINLTPDEDTGIGTWTLDMFVKSLRTGRHMGEGRPILPPMPWEGFAQASDEDLAAVFAYLQSIPPVENVVPEPLPPLTR